MPLTLDQGEAVCLIRLKGEIDITTAADLKKLLLRALASGKDMCVDLERATELDVTALQLLWAADREARGSGRSLKLAGPVPAELLAAVNNAGFESFPIGSARE